MIDDTELWMLFHGIRNLRSHTYETDTANEAFEAAKRFIGPSRLLLRWLEAHND